MLLTLGAKLQRGAIGQATILFFFDRQTEAKYITPKNESQGGFPGVYREYTGKTTRPIQKKGPEKTLPPRKQCPRECTKEFLKRKVPISN